MVNKKWLNHANTGMIVVALIGAIASITGAYISSNKGTKASESAQKAKVSAQNVTGLMPLGTIITSTFSYAELCQSIGEQATFSTKNTWAPADGRSVQGSKFSETKNEVPDLRGAFIRGLNKFYPDNNGSGIINNMQLDINNARSVGDFQPDATKLPNNSFTGSTTKGGEHDHTFKEYSSSGSTNGPHWEGRDKARDTHVDGKGSHEHSFEINDGGDEETRPKNIAVYYYVKIN